MNSSIFNIMHYALCVKKREARKLNQNVPDTLRKRIVRLRKEQKRP